MGPTQENTGDFPTKLLCTHVSTEDIQALVRPVLRHRLIVNFAAESDGITPDDVVEKLIEVTPTKEDELTSDARFQKIFAS